MATCTSCGTTSTGTTNTNKNQTCTTDPWISCEECNALKKCVKKVVCDVLQCLADAICAPQRQPAFDQNGIQTNSRYAPVTGTTLGDCLKTAICSFAECVPDAICGPRAQPPAIGTDLPCDFAVEEQKSVQGQVFLIQENA